MDLHIESIERTPVEVPFRDIPARNMIRELPHWTRFEVIRVRLHGGAVGWGESMQFYTWGRTGDDDLKRAWGRNAAELMWDDSLGSGLQIALFDAVGRATGVPVHALLGTKLRDRVPLSWWDIDMPPEDWAAECRTALAAGYTDFKTKGRPWFDNDAQLAAVAKVVPEGFKFDIDYNDMLLDAERAARVLPHVEKTYPFVAIFESPIPQGDVEGGKRIQKMTDVAIAHHYGNPPIMTALHEDVCDGFVVGGGAAGVSSKAAVCAAADKPFWLQLVGTGITAAFSTHLGAVLSHATWPAVNCHQLYQHSLLAEPIRVQEGTAAVFDGPGLGVGIDEDAVARFRVDPIESQPPGPMRLIVVEWPDGRRAEFTHGQTLFNEARRAQLPVFEPGVRTTVLRDDGSSGFRDRHAKAHESPTYSWK